MGCPCSAASHPRQRQDAGPQEQQVRQVGSGRGYRWTGPRVAKTEPAPPAPAEQPK